VDCAVTCAGEKAEADDAPDDAKNGIVDIHTIVGDAMVPHPEWQERRVDHNTGTGTGSVSSQAACGGRFTLRRRPGEEDR
jgi:hypothetical protein